MTYSLGIAGVVRRKETLEARIERHLASIATDTQLKANYVDPVERQRVRRRALNGAALDAIFEHQTPEEGPEGLEIETGGLPDLWSELAAARRYYLHDIRRLDRGYAADAILVAASRESLPDQIIGDKATTYKRLILIYWLVAAELWTTEDRESFASRNSVYELGSKLTVFKTSTIESEHSRIRARSRFSSTEHQLFDDLVRDIRSSSAGTGQTSLQLFLPAVRALSVSHP
jgi:hypothetical protein